MPKGRPLRLWGTRLAIVSIFFSILGLGGHHPNFLVPLLCLNTLAIILYLTGKMRDKQTLKLHIFQLLLLIPAGLCLWMLVPLPLFLRELLQPAGTADILQSFSSLVAISPPAFFPLSIDPPQTALRFLQLLGASSLFLILYDAFYSNFLRSHFVDSLLIGCTIVFLVPIAHTLLSIDHIWGVYRAANTPIFAPLINNHHLARVFGLLSFLMLGIASQTKERWIQLWFFLLSFGCGGLLLLTLSKSGIVLFSATLMAFSFVLYKRRHTAELLPLKKDSRFFSLLAAMNICLVPAGFAFIFAFENIWGKVQPLGADFSKFSHWALFAPFSNLLGKYWISGGGPGSLSASYFSNIHPSETLPPLLSGQFHVSFFENIGLQIFYDYGIFKGLFLLASIAAILWITLKKAKSFSPLLFALFAGLIFLFLGETIDFSIETSACLYLVTLFLAKIAFYSGSNRKLEFNISKHKFATSSGLLVLTLLVSFCSIEVFHFARRNLDKNLKSGDLSIASLETAVAKHPLDAQYTLLLAEKYLQFGQAKRAQIWLDHTLRLRPNKTKALFYSARLMGQKGQIKRALATYKQSWISDPRLARTIMKDVARITNNIRERLAVLPNLSAPSYQVHCDQLESETRLKRTLVCYDRLSLMQDATETQKLLAAKFSLHKMKDAKGALTRLETLFRKTPLDGAPPTILLEAYAMQFGTKKAIEKADFLVTNMEDKTPTLLWMSNVFAMEGNIIRFERIFRHIKKINLGRSSSHELQKNEIEGYVKMEEYAKALALTYELNNKNKPEATWLHRQFSYEVTLHQIGRALQTLSNLESRFPDYPELAQMKEQV